jgi:small-conductance mechanosensitive channel
MDGIADWFSDGDLTGRLVLTLLLFGALFTVRSLVLRTVRSRVEGGSGYFRTKKWLAYVATVIAVVGLVQIWFGGGGGLTTYLGILSAGIAIALANVLENLAGWVFIVTRRPFRVGDRVEVEGRSGDVVDIRAFRFSMLEIGNWVDADQSTGRLVHVPNGKVFSTPVANYTEGFPYIWDELSVLVTFDSDWREAERIVAASLSDHAPDSTDPQIVNSIRQAGEQYLIRYQHLTPTTYVSVKDYGVMISGRYLVGARARRSVKDALWRSILESIAEESKVDVAYPTRRIVYSDDVIVRHLPGESHA